MSSIFLCGKRRSVQMDEAQRVLLWNAFAELKDSDGTAMMPFKSRRIKDRVGARYQARRTIIIGLRDTHSEGAVAH